MNALVLGGTVFFGCHVVDALVARGHRVTTFDRGTHRVDAHLPLTHITGDRTRPDDLQHIPAAGILAVDTARAQHAGLKLRPVIDTVRATRAWFGQTGRTSLRSGLDPQRETELLDTWNAAILS